MTIKTVTLRPFEEIFGVLQTLDKDDLEVAVVLSCSNNLVKVVFQAGSPEAEVLRREVNESWIGKKVSMLKTDSPLRPLVFKVST